MNRLPHKDALPALREVLGQDLEVKETPEHGPDAAGDVLAVCGKRRFVVGFRSFAFAARIRPAAEALRSASNRLKPKALPLLVVPYMGEVGRRLCAEAGVSWIDLSGNARVVAPGLRIEISGRPNRFPRRGRPSTAFAPVSARVARMLLIRWPNRHSQREIAKQVSLGEGFVSRIVRRLEEDGLVARNPEGAVRPRDPKSLLDAWRDEYDFAKHSILRGHVAARSGDTLLRELVDTLARRKIRHAATGLAAAWQWSRFATFRIVTLYLAKSPSPDLLQELGFREETEAPNVWLVVPNDLGVFAGAAPKDGVECAHPVQVYLDLKGHPERAAEAAERLREEFLNWKAHD